MQRKSYSSYLVRTLLQLQFHGLSPTTFPVSHREDDTSGPNPNSASANLKLESATMTVMESTTSVSLCTARQCQPHTASTAPQAETNNHFIYRDRVNSPDAIKSSSNPGSALGSGAAPRSSPKPSEIKRAAALPLTPLPLKTVDLSQQGDQAGLRPAHP